jgi:hypothetical protein
MYWLFKNFLFLIIIKEGWILLMNIPINVSWKLTWYYFDWLYNGFIVFSNVQLG